jgi:hypothetical protein
VISGINVKGGRGEDVATDAAFAERPKACCRYSGTVRGRRWAPLVRNGRSGRGPFVPMIQTLDLEDRYKAAFARRRETIADI